MSKVEIENIRKKLNEFSFTKVIEKGTYSGQGWNTREEFIECNKGCCTLCEGAKCASPLDEKQNPEHNGFRLYYVSHGAHTLDFCEAMKIDMGDDWNDQPVLFLFENPSIQYDELYGEKVEGEYDKRPAKKWYWLHDGYKNGVCLDYPKYYRQGCYAELVASLIKTFRLRNSYMTNFVKCAMNDADGKNYLGTAYYNPECIENCFNHVLLEEIKMLTDDFRQKLIVFAFSQRVYGLAQDYLGKVDALRDKYSLCLMPHPASRLANDYRKYVIFGKVYKTLNNNDIECDAALNEFLENDKSNNEILVNSCDVDREALITKFEHEGIKICDRRIGGNDTGTVKLLPTELKCKFKLNDKVYEFGFVFGSDEPFWIWDGEAKSFRDKASEASAKLGELFDIFHQFVSEQMR